MWDAGWWCFLVVSSVNTSFDVSLPPVFNGIESFSWRNKKKLLEKRQTSRRLIVVLWRVIREYWVSSLKQRLNFVVVASFLWIFQVPERNQTCIEFQGIFDFCYVGGNFAIARNYVALTCLNLKITTGTHPNHPSRRKYFFDSYQILINFFCVFDVFVVFSLFTL